ncbi:hypothetical protein [Kitasatospora aureofaciens]|uniref:hypothetical protein n=1 Tax=Kitasatospora aureofaciens TaxID=1894 RepID=UPI0012FF57C2|nr:hypothetical protein [Kitasatospora aureofaciens]
MFGGEDEDLLGLGEAGVAGVADGELVRAVVGGDPLGGQRGDPEAGVGGGGR